jgi:RNA polymerase sigma factor (sigma-70 family)
VSPLVVRRYRAERLLRDEFESLRAAVLRAVRARLRASGAMLDADDLEACYSQAWQGLYAAVLDGAQIDDPRAWLMLVTYRRAIDEHRSRRAIAFTSVSRQGAPEERRVVAARGEADAGAERDIVAQLDDRARLRQLFEALRARLSPRERQAATLCYLQGLSRAEAAARMGVSESRMRKLMDGRGSGSPGVAAKLGALAQAIDDGAWCEQQGSLMRALAFGILNPLGERYRLATLHRDACPACRAYVLSLRGLAAAVPPAPVVLHWALGAGAVSGAGASGGAGLGAGTGASSGAGGSLGSGLGGSALTASGAAAGGAAGGGWWLAGPLGAKLAVGCLLALGVGAGCVALDAQSGHVREPHRRPHAHRAALARAAQSGAAGAGSLSGSSTHPRVQAATGAPAAPVAASARAEREFGPERSARSATAAAAAAQGGATSPTASAASSRSRTSAPTATGPDGGASSSGVPAAQREFAPG